MIVYMIYLRVRKLPEHLHLRKAGALWSHQRSKGEQAALWHWVWWDSLICTDSFRLTAPAWCASYSLSSGAPVCNGMDGTVRSSSLQVPSVPWHLCRLVFAWNPSLSLCFLLESCCLVLSDTTFLDSMLPIGKISHVSTWQATLRLNFISHCFLLQSLPFLVPSLFPNNQVASLNSSFV